jgi:hypothetical protein
VCRDNNEEDGSHTIFTRLVTIDEKLTSEIGRLVAVGSVPENERERDIVARGHVEIGRGVEEANASIGNALKR